MEAWGPSLLFCGGVIVLVAAIGLLIAYAFVIGRGLSAVASAQANLMELVERATPEPAVVAGRVTEPQPSRTFEVAPDRELDLEVAEPALERAIRMRRRRPPVEEELGLVTSVDENAGLRPEEDELGGTLLYAR
jgi:hypothetical protein